jgi:hypothetical protein
MNNENKTERSGVARLTQPTSTNVSGTSQKEIRLAALLKAGSNI